MNAQVKDAKASDEIRIPKGSEIAVVFFMDGNSAPGFSAGEFKDGKKDNVCTTLLNSIEPRLKNYTDEIGTVTVNKIRGPASEQPHKVGEYQLNIVDYLMTSDHFQWADKGHPGDSLPSFSKEELAKPSECKKAHGEILPSLECPSDHYPVKGVLRYKS